MTGDTVDQTQAENAARQGYDQMAQVYADHVAQETTVPSLVRANLEYFAHLVQKSGPGQVADVGCGPGQITAFLRDLGLDVFGIDISPALLDIAATTYPEIQFETGELAALPMQDDSLQAVVSRHSLIHTPAEFVPRTLTEFARVLVPGGLLWLSFFAAEQPDCHGKPFDHAVTTAYRFDVDVMAEQLAAAGLVEEVRIVRQPAEGERQLPHGVFFARLPLINETAQRPPST